MKTLFANLLAATLAVSCGCETKSTPGGPGANTHSKVMTNTTDSSHGGTRDVTHATTVTHETGDKADTFTLTGPATSTTLKQGEKKELTVGIDRGKTFHQDVKLSFKAPNGLKVTTDSGNAIKASDKDAKIWVEAAKDAPLGKHTIEVTTTPETGTATTLNVDVNVTKVGGKE